VSSTTVRAEDASLAATSSLRARAEVLSWTYWQVGGPRPMFGQLGSFGREKPRDDHAFEKFHAEAKRLAGVLDGHLRDREWIALEYSIADIVNYPWFDALSQFQPNALDGAEAVKAWMKRIGRASRRPEGNGARGPRGPGGLRPWERAPTLENPMAPQTNIPI
jgi:GST-like protein